MTAVLLVAAYAAVLAMGAVLYLRRHRWSRRPLQTATTVALLAYLLADLGEVSGLPLAIVAVLPAWLGLLQLGWIGEGRRDVLPLIVRVTGIVAALELVIALSLALGAQGLADTWTWTAAARRVVTVGLSAAVSLTTLRWLDSHIITRAGLAGSTGAAAGVALWALIGAWLGADEPLFQIVLVTLALGGIAGVFIGGLLAWDQKRLGAGSLRELAESREWVPSESLREPFARLFWEAAGAHLVVDMASGRVLDANLEALAVSARDLRGARLHEVFADPLPEAGGEVRTKLERHQEQLPVEVRVSRFSLSGSDVRLVSLRDLRAEQLATERQIRAERLEVVGRIAGGISHDFNNILQGVLGYADLLDPDGDRETLRKGLATIRRYAERGAELSRSMTELSRDQEVLRGSCDARDAIDSVAVLVRKGLLENLRVIVRTSEEPCPVPLAPTRLEEIVLQLAINARDAMPDGGLLRLTARPVVVDELDVSHGVAHVPGPYIEVSVQDDGPGMPASLRKVAFEPYVSGKGSTGLGLALVHSAVAQIEGSVVLESVEGQGTVVRMLLPRAPESAADEHERYQPSLLPEDVAPRVLVVDDEEDLRDMIAMILEARGYHVTQASGGKVALQLIAESEGFDVILLDMVMPDMNGAQVVRTLRDRGIRTPVVLATGYAPEDLDADCRSLVAGVLRKPFVARELVDMLTDATC